VRLPEFARSTSVRWAVGVAGAFAICTLLLFGFVYFQAANYVTGNFYDSIAREMDEYSSYDLEIRKEAIAESLRQDPRRIKLDGLFGADGKWIAGNIDRLPNGFNRTRPIRDARVIRLDERGREMQSARLASRVLDDGTILVVGRNVDELHEFAEILGRTLVIGLAPAFLLAVAAGILLSQRANRRIEEVNKRVRRIVAGHLHERLPVHEVDDPFDKLARIVNGMLEEIEGLIGEIAGVGDDIAHDLRTPLSRARTILERGRDNARTVEEFRAVTDRSIASLDQGLAIITALLRIAEIEHGRRLAGFGAVDLADLAGEVGELYAPIAEDRGIALSVDARRGPAVRGDRDLLFEAMANLIDNAMKFTPPGGEVALDLEWRANAAVVRVKDNGPGIGVDERDAVLKRFYRSDKSRHTPGVGLGLSLVAAIVKLHGFNLTISPAPGCTVEIVCRI
jgi:signal transduction histidine kinase